MGPLLLLSKLRYLSLGGTAIGMVGLRRLAAELYENPREFEIEAPESCHEYTESEYFLPCIQLAY